MGLKASLLKLYFGIENIWYGALDFLDKKLHIPVYKVFINWVEKMGVPSLAFYFLVAVVAGAAWYFLAGPAPAEKVSFTVLVQMAGEPLAGLTVSIEGGGLVFTKETSGAGVAKFEDIPLLEELTLTISRDDQVLLSKVFDPRTEKKLLRIDLATELAAVAKMIVSSDAGPVEGAVVSYSSPTTSNTTTTNAAGEAELYSVIGETVSYTVSKEGLVEESGSFVAEREKTISVFLHSPWPTPTPLPESDTETVSNQSITPPEYGTVIVRVKDKETSEGIDALVKLRNAEDNSLVNETIADRGVAIFSRVKINTKVYAFASALNYVYDISPNTTVEEETEIIIFLEKTPEHTNDSNASYTQFIVRDSNTSLGIVGANLSIFGAQNYSDDYSAYALLETFLTGSGGKLNTTLLNDKYYYATAKATNYFTEATTIFRAGEHQNISLTKITADKIASLNATVYESRTNGIVAGARVTLKNTQGAQIAQSTTNQVGKAYFPILFKGSVLKAVGTGEPFAGGGTWTGSASVTLSAASNAVDITLSPPRGKIIARAVNSSNPNQVLPATFYAFQGGVEVASCPVATASCEMTVDALVDTEVSAAPTTPGFMPGSVTGINLAKDEARNVSIPVVSAAEICGCGPDCGTDPKMTDPTKNFQPPLCIKILGVTVRDERGYQVSQMQFGKIYSLEFRVASLGAHTTGLYVRVGDLWKTSLDYVFLTGADITGLNSSRIFAVRGSNEFYRDIPSHCYTHPYLDVVNVNRILNQEANAFKWLEVEVANDPAKFATGQTITIPFKQIVFVPKGAPPTSVSVYYRAWARRYANATGGTLGETRDYYRRVPIDYDLSFDEAYNATLDLAAWAAGEARTPAGEP